jgi:hypothetical protein
MPPPPPPKSSEDYTVVVGDIFDRRFIIKDALGKVLVEPARDRRSAVTCFPSQGAFGVVVEAYDRVHGVDVALKVIKKRDVYIRQARLEISLLKHMQRVDPEDNHHTGEPRQMKTLPRGTSC